MESDRFDFAPKSPLGLAIEVIRRSGSVAVVNGGQILSSTALPNEARSTASLGPVLDQIWKKTVQERGRFDFIAVANGPGSFTGLRIAVASAKTLAYAANIPVIAVDSLAAVGATVLQGCTGSRNKNEARNKIGDHANHDHPSSEPPLRPQDNAGVPTNSVDAPKLLIGMSAYRGQVYCGQVTNKELNEFPGRSVSRIVSSQDWNSILQSANTHCLLTGDRKLFVSADALSLSTRWLEPTEPIAIGVGLLAARMMLAKQTQDPMTLVPSYLRPSAAEEQSATKDHV